MFGPAPRRHTSITAAVPNLAEAGSGGLGLTQAVPGLAAAGGRGGSDFGGGRFSLRLT